VDPPRALRRPARAETGGGAARIDGPGAPDSPGAARWPPAPAPGRERALERHRDSGRDPDRQARGHRRRADDVAAELRPPRRRRREEGHRRALGRRLALVAHPHRRAERLAVRVKEQGEHAVAKLVARSADAVVAVSDAIAAEARGFSPRGPVVTIANGSDFDDFAGLEYRRADRFRITHTGSFFGKRTPRPFLTGLAQSGLDDVVARFLGDFRTPDREWAETLGLGERLELHAYAPRRVSLELQRDSDVLLLLIPEAGGRGKGVLSGKVFEYLAAERPILAVVPPDGAAAALIRETGSGIVVAPEDVDGIAEALRELHDRWRNGGLEQASLPDEVRLRVSRESRARELAELLWSLP
jgi:glycosyltransferase involved in cell wall biosynthesis